MGLLLGRPQADGRGGGPWQIAASLEMPAQANWLPVFTSGQSPTFPANTFMAYDLTGVGAGGVGNGDGVNDFVTTDAWKTSSGSFAGDASQPGGTGDRALWAAFLGNVVLGDELSVFSWHGRPLTAAQASNSGNHRTWFDGIGYGPAVDGHPPIPNVPEPASVVLLGIVLAGLGLVRRR